MITEYDMYPKDVLIGMLLERDEYIDDLETEIAHLNMEIEDKTNKDFEDNKMLAADLINSFKEVLDEK